MTAPVRHIAPAHDLDAEAAVLSALLLSPSRFEGVATVLAPADFYSIPNRRIAEVIWALVDEGRAIDITLVAARLRERDLLQEVGGTPYLAQVQDQTPAVANVEDHARIVAERARRRRFTELCRTLAADAVAGAPLEELSERVRQSVTDAYPSRSDALARIGAAEVFAPLPAVEWLVRGLDLCPGAPSLIAGYGFSGKTAAAQAMAIAVGTGGKVWGTFAAKQGRVLHIDYEQGRRLTLERYQRLAAAEMLTPADLGDRLSVVSLPSLYLDSPNAEAILCRECEGHALVIIDSLRAAAPSMEENDSGARRVLDLLGRISERTGVVPLVLHHARKPQKDAAGGAKATIRGSGALFDACGSVLVFEAAKGEPTQVQHEKARTSGAPADDFLLRIEDVEIDGHARAGLRVVAEGVPGATAAGASRIAKTAPTILEVIQKHPGITTRRLREMCAGTREGLVDAAAEALAEQGAIEIRPGPRGARLHFPKEAS